jgi:hypothetical protein
MTPHLLLHPRVSSAPPHRLTWPPAPDRGKHDLIAFGNALVPTAALTKKYSSNSQRIPKFFKHSNPPTAQLSSAAPGNESSQVEPHNTSDLQQAIKYETPAAGSIRAEPANFEECKSIACCRKVKANLSSYPPILPACASKVKKKGGGKKGGTLSFDLKVHLVLRRTSVGRIK